ncbi:MAG: Ca-activated chloride channel [Acidobacteriaceae bacterium]|jgi:Ca-activated chloride channel family protein|nr:Ca-activated chloride channel [Acidobacteriaceae bacterium]MEA2262782.1 Ca-activated chloride channel [Acidobacteriaceae bacterium]
MLARVCLRSRLFRWVSPAALVLLCGHGRPSPAQAQPAQTAPARPVAISPAQAEVQPNLSLDRDPVLSPDADDNLPIDAQGISTAGRSKDLQKDQKGVFTLQENVNEVLLNCTVLDQKGRLVLDLKQGDFRLWEDGVPQKVGSFQHQDLPVSMGILVDNSGSMRDKRGAVTQAALDLVKASNPEDAAFVVNFSDRAYLDQNFTSNIAALERGLARFDSRSTTALYDAVVASAKELATHAKQPKQVVLIITDGADNASRVTLEQAIQRVQLLGGPVVYSIGMLFGDNKEDAETAQKALEALSAETGGVAYFPQSLQDVDEIAKEVAQDIRNQYTIGYHSTKPPNLGGYRTVRVEATAPKHGKLVVRTRKGYYPGAAANNPTVAETK